MALVTVTLTVPVPAGLVAAIWVSETMANDAAVEPKLTAVAPVKPVSVMITVVPPTVGPELGLMLEIVGAAGDV